MSSENKTSRLTKTRNSAFIRLGDVDLFKRLTVQQVDEIDLAITISLIEKPLG
jgi:hypothetical protein